MPGLRTLSQSAHKKGKQKVIAPVKELQTYLESFSDFEKVAVGHDQPWLRHLRADAFARFCEVGLPTTRDEDWRFTNISAIAQTQFHLAAKSQVANDSLAGLRFTEAACQLVFVNGHFAPDLSSLGNLPKGLTVNGLAKEIAAKSAHVESHLGRYLNIQRD